MDFGFASPDIGANFFGFLFFSGFLPFPLNFFTQTDDHQAANSSISVTLKCIGSLLRVCSD